MLLAGTGVGAAFFVNKNNKSPENDPNIIGELVLFKDSRKSCYVFMKEINLKIPTEEELERKEECLLSWSKEIKGYENSLLVKVKESSIRDLSSNENSENWIKKLAFEWIPVEKRSLENYESNEEKKNQYIERHCKTKRKREWFPFRSWVEIKCEWDKTANN
ncbi:hypothetical protein [Mycoplasma suis]|nr:hypothetical protein [Mycoplasma suis]CBZ40300.1 hypothetical protein MSUIS_02070 [Mycoplasma suis KI3806]